MPPTASTPRYPCPRSCVVGASIFTRTFRAGSRSRTSLKNSTPNSPTSWEPSEVIRCTAPAGRVRVKSGSAAASTRTSGAPLSMVKCAGPESSARFTRAPRVRGRVALRAAGEVSKKAFRESKLAPVIVRPI
ncbi:hypothetical protein Anae109_3394 [Anaeromyxobacter sp. Fw109-5]|nr:hypothetical protein Anae109_3394 [Anaeromyxobacter sp. Fw109-5]